MRAVVRVDGAQVAAIGTGLVALVGVARSDNQATADSLANKIVDLRIFRDDEGKTNRSLIDVSGEILAVSQFTLYADTRKGRRPSFLDAAAPDLGERLYARFVAAVAERGMHVERGVFGAEMEVDLVNDGPMTIWLDSAAK